MQTTVRATRPITKEQILTAIQAAARKLGRAPTTHELRRMAGIHHTSVRRHFSTYVAGVRAAGLEPSGCSFRVADAALLKDWGEVVRKLGAVPAKTEYERECRYSLSCFNKHFKRWSLIPAAFASCVQSGALPGDWSDVLEKIRKGPIPVRGGGKWLKRHREAAKQFYERTEREKDSSAGQPQTAQGLDVGPTLPPPLEGKKCVTVSMLLVLLAGGMGLSAQFSRRVLPDRPLLGAPSQIPGLMHEPVNEMGVILLFGMVARQLGFIIESVQAGFPDCEAKLEVEPGRWQRVRIEFEYESRGFWEHRHDPRKCDVIVCWRHNWKQCPPELQVLELSSVLNHR